MGQQERDMFSKLCSRFYCTVVPSEGCIQMLQKEIGQHLYLKIPNMIDVAEIQRKTENTFLYGRNAPDIKIIISVSMIAPEKHFENVIYAVQYLLEKGVQNFRWHIVGGGWDFAKIYAMIQEKHLERYIIMEGIQADPYPYMKGAYLFVHPSYVESQGIAIGEAMALGVPCVVTRSLGPCEFIQDGVNGVLTEQDPISLAKKVEQMLTDPELYARIKENTHCPRQFLPEQVMEQIGGLLG